MALIPEATEAKKKLILKVLDDMKAEDIIEVPLAGKTTIGDYMIIASGGSARHVDAISSHVLETLKKEGYGTARIEGMPTCDWVLLDAGDILIHVFRPEVRLFYNLEKIWSVERPQDSSARLDRD